MFAPAGGPDTDILDNIRGMTFHPQTGNLLVVVGAGPNAHAVAELDLDGNFLGNFIDNGAGGLDSPWFLEFRDADVLVSASGSDNVASYLLDGTPNGVWLEGVSLPEQLQELDNSNVLVASVTEPSGVWEMDADGAQLDIYTGITGNIGVWELSNGNILTTNLSGVHEIDRGTTLVETKIDGVGARFITFVEIVDCSIPEWVDVDPLNGSVPAGGSQAVEVTFDATSLEPGDYEATLCVDSDDPEQPLTTVPLALSVTPAPVPELAFDPPSLDFGDVDDGTTSPPQPTTLQNGGGGAATELGFTGLPGSGFEADTSLCGNTLPAGESCEVMVTFTPAEPEPATATLHATSSEGASADLALAGIGVGNGGFTPMDLEVDPQPFLADGNGVFEPGELVEVAPTWQNDGPEMKPLTGTASSFDGSDGAIYFLALEGADYGNIEPGITANCRDTGVCYFLAVNDPAARPAAHWEAAFDETLSDDTTKTWSLHIGDSFVDVPRTSPFYTPIETLFHHGVTGGCTATEYCASGANTRGQMAVFLLKAAEDGDYVPPACVENEQRFADVPFDSPLCPWIEELAERQVTTGCGGGKYCPGDPVTRAQMAVFLLKAFEGEGHTPPECTGEFTDVTCTSPFAAWVEELATRGVTSGCAGDPPAYCPATPVTRAQMAVFVTRTFGLTLYGP